MPSIYIYISSPRTLPPLACLLLLRGLVFVIAIFRYVVLVAYHGPRSHSLTPWTIVQSITLVDLQVPLLFDKRAPPPIEGNLNSFVPYLEPDTFSG